MNSSLIALILVALSGVLGLTVLFVFAHAVFETALALYRLIQGLIAFIRNAFVTLGWWLVVLIIVAIGGSSWLTYLYWFKTSDIDLAKIKPPVCAELLDRSGKSLDYLCPFDGVRVWKPTNAISPSLRKLVVMLEDAKFFSHGGFDVEEILESIEKNAEKKKIVRGGSTITQQLAKNLFLTKQKSFIRKASEVPLALRLEKNLTKAQILELYFNTIEWGPGVYGAEAASRLYFDRPAIALLEEEAWLLALMIPNPKELNLWIAPKARASLLKRARQLSHRLVSERSMTKREAEEAYSRFESFLISWINRRPHQSWSGRVYPARWQLTRAGSVGEILSKTKGALELMKKDRSAGILTEIDRELQARLEEALPTSKVESSKKVIAIMEGTKIRALARITSAKDIDTVQTLAESLGLRTQTFPSGEIPSAGVY